LELTDNTFDELAAAKVNGRQIRNLTRLAKGRIRLEEMQKVLALAS